MDRLLHLASLSVIVSLSAISANAAKVEPAPDGAAFLPQKIEINTGRPPGETIVVAGKDGAQQLVVTAFQANGEPQDVTRKVEYSVHPENILTVDANGHVEPKSEGTATLQARLGELTDEIQLEVAHFESDLPINFTNDVVPLFTKHGCNGGGCHGKASGQNGFKLSLLGFEPQEDFEFLTRETRGRRLFPAAPERSLLLEKAIAKVPHGGGQRIELNSPPYRVIKRWISQGMPFGSESDPVAVGIEVFPKNRTLHAGDSQQLVVTATYSDGSKRDVTRMTSLESNDTEMAEVTPHGLGKTSMPTATGSSPRIAPCMPEIRNS